MVLALGIFVLSLDDFLKNLFVVLDFEKKKEKCIMIESFAAHLFWYSIYIYIYIRDEARTYS